MRVPLATYRVQLGPRPHVRRRRRAPALSRKTSASSDCYTSPFFETSSTGSHGYDVNDHNQLRAELGGEPAFRRLATALGQRGSAC